MKLVTTNQLRLASARVEHIRRELASALEELNQLQEQYDRQNEEYRRNAPEGSKWSQSQAA